MIEKHGKMFTNIKSNNYQEVKDHMKYQNIYWNCVNGKIETNLTYINGDNIKYNYNYRNSSYGNIHSQKVKDFGDYDIYSSYQEDKTVQATNFLLNKTMYDFMLQHKQLPIYGCLLSLVLLILIAVYLFWAIGHKEGGEGISLNGMDQIPYEIISIICLVFLSVALSIVTNSFDVFIRYVVVIVYIMAYLIGYVACAIWGVTTIKRIKAKTFWRSFLSYKVIRWFYHKIKNGSKNIFS